MNSAYFHLIVNHVPFFAVFAGTVTLAVSMKRKSEELRFFASLMFVLGGIFSWIAVFTGQNAANIVLTVDPASKPFIHEHADAASWALCSGTVIAIFAILLEWAVRKKANWVKALQWILLILALIGSTVCARTMHLGGLIRHTEIRE